ADEDERVGRVEEDPRAAQVDRCVPRRRRLLEDAGAGHRGYRGGDEGSRAGLMAAPPPSRRRGAVGTAIGLLVVVALAAWQVAVIPSPTTYSVVGPSAMPVALVALL